jgi:uridylate kinase
LSTPLVIKITGKAFEDLALIEKFVRVLENLLQEYRVITVVGGGGIARRYIEAARALKVKSNYWLDLIGIWASRLNGLLLISALSGYAHPSIPTSLEEALTALKYSKLVVMGGLIPGQSTAATLLEVAEAVGAEKVYYYSAVGQVYDKDPLKHPNAKPLKVVMASELKALLEQKILPGEYALIDEKALDIAIRSKIEIYILNYREPEQIFSALRGENPGSLILPK